MLRFKLVDLYVVNNFVSKLFFRILYNSTGNRWNLDIDFFQAFTYCNFPNFSLIEFYQDN